MKKPTTDYINKFTTIIILFIITIIFINIYIYGIEEIRSNITKLGYWAPLAIFIFRFTSVVIPALPGTVYSILAGSLLGFEKGLFVICISDLISCSLSFYIARKFGKGVVTKFTGSTFLSKIQKFSKNNIENNFILMTGFLVTGFFDFVSYALGLTNLRYNRFLLSLIISILISNPPIVALGSGIFEQGKNLLIFSAIGMIIIGLISSRFNNRLTKSNK